MSHPAPPPAPPVAPRRPTVLRHHGDERVDDWYWLRERDDPEVRAYLEAENAYTTAALAHLAPLRERLFEEIRGRIRENDASAPVAKGPHEYFTRTREGLQYPVHCRRPARTPGLPAPDAEPGTAPGEIVLLDENALAGDSGYFALGALSPSPDQALVAYSTDFTGGETYTLRVRDVASGRRTRRRPRPRGRTSTSSAPGRASSTRSTAAVRPVPPGSPTPMRSPAPPTARSSCSTRTRSPASRGTSPWARSRRRPTSA